MDADRLRAVLEDVYGPEVVIDGLERDGAGASRLTQVFEAAVPDGTRHRLVLRLATPGGLAAGAELGLEARLMRSAAAAGVPTPDVVASGDDFIVMRHVAGETVPRRVLRSPARALLAEQCGRILADVHRAEPVAGLDGADQLTAWGDLLHGLPDPYPALELGLRRLSLTRPPAGRTTVVHGDFRNGNLIVGPDGVRAVLDWELAHLGDPLEDLGWLCVKAWRFGSPLPVGGFGTYDELVTAYEEASGHPVDRDALRWWEAFGVFKWAVVCIMQTRRHLDGGERSVELAALGRRVAANEWDLLKML